MPSRPLAKLCVGRQPIEGCSIQLQQGMVTTRSDRGLTADAVVIPKALTLPHLHGPSLNLSFLSVIRTSMSVASISIKGLTTTQKLYRLVLH
jgi:hypothetical protein